MASDETTEAMEVEVKPTEQNPPESAMDISPEKDGGILKEVIREGDGKSGPSPGDTVFVHYVGTLTNGEKFDSSRDRGEKFEFQLGKGKVIKGWDIGVATMTRGELARLWCKSDYAYGESGSPPKIPPNATLVFEVELFDWKGEDISPDKDGGIMKHEVKKGDGYKTPNDEALVQIHYTGRYSGTDFEEKDADFEAGDALEKGLIPALDVIAKNMKKGEVAKFDIAPKYAYGTSGNPQFNIPPHATVEFEVEMKDFEKTKESWEMNTQEKLEQSAIAKTKGTTFFKDQNYKKAVHNYKKIVNYLQYETSLEAEEQKTRDALMLAAHLNLAMCYLKMGDCFEVMEQCDKALEMDGSSVKALFRRGEARFQTSEYDDAKADFEEVLKLEADNKAAKNKIILCNQKIKQFKDKQKKIYGGMFSKFAQQDAKKEAKVNAETKESIPENSNKDGDSAVTENGAAETTETRAETMEA